MTRFQTILFFIIFTTILSSCDNNGKTKQKGMLFTSGGRTSEVLVVMNDQNWKRIAGDTVRNTLGAIPEWQAVPEPEYMVSHINKVQFGSVYQKFRNILIVEFKPEFKKSKILVKHNVWSKPQTVVKIKVADMKSFLKIYSETYIQIKELFHKNELKRIANAYKGMEVKPLTIKLKKKFAIEMVFPKGFFVATDGADFMWIRRPSRDVEEGVFVYTYPYTDTSNFNFHRIIAIRDSITKKYIPGPIDGSYMKVSSVFPPMVTITDFKGNYSTEIRSWWDVHGYAMGGPYISYTFVDTIANRMMCIDGYIKAPRKDKRDLMLHLEAIFSTFEFVNKETEKKN
jgi:hypothetical protein